MNGSGAPGDTRVGARRRALAWLNPGAEGVAALLSSPLDPGSTSVILADAPLVAFLLRFRPDLAPGDDPLDPGEVRSPQLLDCLALGIHAGRKPLWAYPAAPRSRLAKLGHEAVTRAGKLAELSGLPPHSANQARVLARLCFLGLDAAARVGRPAERPLILAWRLARRLGLPGRVQTLLLTMHLAPDDAAALGADATIGPVVRATLAAHPLGAIGRAGWGLVPAPESALGRDAAELAAQPIPERPRRPVPFRTQVELVEALAASARDRRRDRDDALAGQLEAATIRLEERLHAAKLSGLAEFAAGASHEINNPLAVIRGHASLMLGKETDPARQSGLRTIARQTVRIQELLQGTRQFARPPKPRFSAVDVRAAVLTVAEHHRLDAEGKGVSLVVEPMPEPLAAWADAGHLAQVVSQLVRNGVEAAPPGGEVRLSARHAGGAAVVECRDDGPGPPDSHLPHLFDPFFSGREAGRGRGLGLSVAWQLARQNGGSVEYAGREGGHTVFRVTLARPGVMAASNAA